MIQHPDFNRVTEADGSVRPAEDNGYRFKQKTATKIPVVPAPSRRDDGA